MTNFSDALTQKNGLVCLGIKNVAPISIFLKLVSLFGISTQYTGTKKIILVYCAFKNLTVRKL